MIRLKNILVPIDFSEHGATALKYAVEFADQYGAAVHLLHVHDPIPAGALLSYRPIEELRASMQQYAEGEMDKLQEAWSDHSFPVTRVIREGHAFVEIVQYAKEHEIDLIIMGTHGRGAVAHMMLGSVAEKTLRKAPCPVLTVRHPEHEFVHP